MKPATIDVAPHPREPERGGVWSKRGVFLAGTAGGALIWLASPLVTGYREPWDSPGPYYSLSLGCLGVVLGALAPRLFWLAWLAGLFGEFLVFASRALVPPQELWVLGVVALIVYAGVILLGAVVGALANVLARWVQHRPRTGAGT